MAVACLAVVLAGNTELAWRFEYAGFPLSWAFGGLAVLALVAFEFCDCNFSPASEREDRSYRPSFEWDTAERFDLIRRDAAGVSLSTTEDHA